MFGSVPEFGETDIISGPSAGITRKQFPAVVFISVMVLAIVSQTVPAYTVSPNPIKHIVIVVQENHSFDNMFGTFPGLKQPYADPLNSCQPISTTNPSAGCIKPWNGDSKVNSIEARDLNHGYTAAETAYNGGKMNGFIPATQLKCTGTACPPLNETMSYFDGQVLPNYWDYASTYALDANFYSSFIGDSYPNHLYMFSGQDGIVGKGGPNIYFNLTFNTIANQMAGAGVSWGWFSSNWNDTNDCKPAPVTSWKFSLPPPSYLNGWGDPLWDVPVDFPSLQTNSATCGSMHTFTDLQNDLTTGYLPQVSWVIPNGQDSDHPSATVTNGFTNGQEYVASLVNKIMGNTTLWDSTAIFLLWDDFGGFYDNVVPNQVDSLGYGFRVPLVIISPWVRQGISYGTWNNGAFVQQDFTALLATIANQYTLPSLTARETMQKPLWYLFNFNQTPLPPLFLPTTSLATYPVSSCTVCSTTPTAGSLSGTLPMSNSPDID